MSETQTPQWFNQLKQKLTDLAEQFDLDPIQSEQFRETMFGLCKSEYVSGSKSGAAWAFKRAAEKRGSSQAVAA
ncbi:MAG: hypothetical protein NTX72_00075 [Candidatus Uhrbacteria bacterium]|nr:hypothetical protein [Candidatus Uhrbacteria bacterium]